MAGPVPGLPDRPAGIALAEWAKADQEMSKK
jgi:hypothetical protein